MQEGIEYGVDTIDEWKGVTKKNCMDIAKTVRKSDRFGLGPLYWSYNTEQKVCSIKNGNGNPTSGPSSISGTADCGTRIPGRNLDNLLMNAS